MILDNFEVNKLSDISDINSSPIPGLHIIADLHSSEISLLKEHREFKLFVKHLIEKYNLNELGNVYYDFPTGGFTAVICLSESHISIHTWPENGFIAFDVFLSNYNNDNRSITKNIYTQVCQHFNATILKENLIDR